jgi:hypothetical protein
MPGSIFSKDNTPRLIGWISLFPWFFLSMYLQNFVEIVGRPPWPPVAKASALLIIIFVAGFPASYYTSKGIAEHFFAPRIRLQRAALGVAFLATLVWVWVVIAIAIYTGGKEYPLVYNDWIRGFCALGFFATYYTATGLTRTALKMSTRTDDQPPASQLKPGNHSQS